MSIIDEIEDEYNESKKVLKEQFAMEKSHQMYTTGDW